MRKKSTLLILTLLIVINLVTIPQIASAAWTPYWFNYYWSKIHTGLIRLYSNLESLNNLLDEINSDVHQALLTALYHAGVNDGSITWAKLSSGVKDKIYDSYAEHGEGTIDFPSIPEQSCAIDTVEINCDIMPGDIAVANPVPVTDGVETMNLTWNAWVSGTNVVTIRVCNPTAGALDPASQTWHVNAWYY